MREFYLGVSSGGRASARAGPDRRRKRWLSERPRRAARGGFDALPPPTVEHAMTGHYDALRRATRRRAEPCSPRCPGRSRMPGATRRAFARILADVDPAAITSRAALAQLPVTRKSEWWPCRRRPRPSVASTRPSRASSRASSRPYLRSGGAPRYWRMARPLFAAGFSVRRGDPQTPFRYRGGLDGPRAARSSSTPLLAGIGRTTACRCRPSRRCAPTATCCRS